MNKINYFSKVGTIDIGQSRVALLQSYEILLLPFQNYFYIKNDTGSYIQPEFEYQITKESSTIVINFTTPTETQFNYLFLILAITVEGLSLIPSSEKQFNQSMNPTMNINLSRGLAEKFL